MTEWLNYERYIQEWTIKSSETNPGHFSENKAYIFWQISNQIPLPDVKPTLTLPLRFHLCRDSEQQTEKIFGCKLSVDDCITMVPIINYFWTMAGIQFSLIGVYEECWEDLTPGTLANIHEQICSLSRNPQTGQMQNKDLRRKLFLEKLIPHHHTLSDAFDVYMFDFIGQESQGISFNDVM